MLQYMTIFAVSLAAYAGASYWALLCGIAALSLLAIAGDGVMTRVIIGGDDDIVHFSLRQIAMNAFWASTTAYALGVVVRLIYT